jgi:asparagine synthase (glutamine-hydrolysing)
VRTYNVSFEESKFDEAPYARRVAEALGTEHHEFRLTQKLFTDGLESALGSLDQPTFDAINTYFVSRIVREAGATVALAGTGGDELFGGYTSFSELPSLRRVSRLGRRVPRRLVTSAVRVKVGASGGFPPQTRWGKLPDAMATGGRLLELYQVAYGLFTSDFLQELAAQNGEAAAVHSGIPDARAAELRELISSSPDLTGIAALELSCFLGERLLRDTDAASMASSLEVRVPLLDHEFIESLAALDEQTRFSPVRSKRLLKELALGDLDPAIFDRPKSGFVLPLEVWCKQKLGGEVAATLKDAELCRSVGLDPGAVDRIWTAFQAGAPGLYWSRIWALFIVLWWSRTHGAAR